MTQPDMIRLGGFALFLVLFSLWELYSPRRKLTASRAVRWFSNLSLVSLNTLLVPVLAPVMALGMAQISHEEQWGIFNFYQTPYPWALILSIVALDFIIYLQHVIFHALPVLWRLHRVHHSDVDLDVTSAVRFHFLEILISMMIKLSAIALLGAPVLAVLAFEVLLNATAMFNHANIRLPDPLDRVMRWVIVTPDMHRVHHSVVPSETNSNFGFNMPWWDYLCGTYRAQPAAGHKNMTIGVEQFREKRDQYLDRLLVQPFLSGRG